MDTKNYWIKNTSFLKLTSRRYQPREKRVENSTNDLAKTEVASVEVANRDTASDIDALYTVMERGNQCEEEICS